MPTQAQLDLAKKYYTQEQINQELANPWSVKRVDFIGTPKYEPLVNGKFASAGTTTPTPTTGVTPWKIGWSGMSSTGTPPAPTTTTTTPPAPVGTPPAPIGTETGPAVPWTLRISDLSSELQGIYNSDPYAKAAFDMAAKAGQQQWDEAIEKYTGIIQNTQANEKYLSEKAKNEQAQAAIVQGENVANLQRGIEKADSNFNYASGSSAKSSVATTAVAKQMEQMHTQLANYIALNKLQNDGYSKAVEEQMRQIEVWLQQQIGKVLTEALNSLDNGVATGEVATDAQLKAMFEKNSEALLKQVPALSQNAFNQMDALMNGFIRQQDQNRETAKNNFVVNDAISKETGILTNMNGTPILDLAGNQIKVDPAAPLPPQFNKDTGEVVTFTKNANGTIIGTTTKVDGYTTPPKEPTKRNVIMVDGKPYDVDQERFLTIPEQNSSDYGGWTGTYTPPKGFESRGAGQSIPVINTGDGIEIGIPNGTKLQWVGGECGGLVNDFASSIQWYKRVGDTWESKLANRNSMEPVEWGLVMWTPWTFEDNGHIGIVEKVFDDGSFQIYDSNYVAEKTTSRRIIRPWDKEYNLIQKTGWFFDPRKSAGGGTGTNLRTLGQFMKDNQQMGQWYSEKDVARFDEKIDRYAANNDETNMLKAYREMLLRDTDFKKEFDNTQKFTRALDDVSSMIEQYEAAGKSTNAARALAEKVARGLGMTTDAALAQLQTQMWFTLANYIRSISGTAASDVEVQRLMGNMAKIGNVKELNMAIVDQARNNATSALKSMVDTRMYGLPEELKPKVFGDVYTTGSTSTPQGNMTPAWNNKTLPWI